MASLPACRLRILRPLPQAASMSEIAQSAGRSHRRVKTDLHGSTTDNAQLPRSKSRLSFATKSGVVVRCGGRSFASPSCVAEASVQLGTETVKLPQRPRRTSIASAYTMVGRARPACVTRVSCEDAATRLRGLKYALVCTPRPCAV